MISMMLNHSPVNFDTKNLTFNSRTFITFIVATVHLGAMIKILIYFAPITTRLHVSLGYQRLQGYRQRDGSYSLFNARHASFEDSDDSGSVAVTSLAIRSMALAGDYIFTDDQLVKKGIAWLRSKQQNSGCFHEEYDRSYLAAYQQKPLELTAFVLVSLLESGVPKKVRWYSYLLIDESNHDKCDSLKF